MMPDSIMFIDGANANAMCKNMGWFMDWSKFRATFANVDRLMYYTATFVEENGHQKIRPLLDYLEYNHYTVIKKEAKSYVNADGSTSVKGNMDVEIAVDAMKLAKHYKFIYLFTGDGDFVYLVKALQDRGCVVHLIAPKGGNVTSDDLIRACDAHYELTNGRALFAKVGVGSRVE